MLRELTQKYGSDCSSVKGGPSVTWEVIIQKTCECMGKIPPSELKQFDCLTEV